MATGSVEAAGSCWTTRRLSKRPRRTQLHQRACYSGWALQKGWAVIPKSSSKSRIAANVALDFELSSDEMASLRWIWAA